MGCEQTLVCAATMKYILLLAIVACAGAQFQYFTGEVSKAPARRSFSSGYSSGSDASSSAYTSGTPATPAPTEAGSTTITQKVVMGFPGLTSHTAFAGSNEQTLANYGYGHALDLVVSTNTGTDFKAGCRVTSTAAAARRADMSVTFEAVVTPALAAAAQTSANALVTDSSSLTTAMQTVLSNLKQSDAGTYSSMSNPTVSSVSAPTVTTAGGSASTTATLSAVALIAAAALALKQ